MIKIPTLCVRATELAVRSDALPDGVCGIVTGLALRYGVIDSWGTKFLPGSVDKTRSKVAARKVKLFANHGFADAYGIRTHIGTVSALVLAGDAEVMTAELFDTEEGRHAKAYLDAVQKSRAETGLSIGFHPRGGDWEAIGDDKYGAYAFSEIELDEISLAPRNAVPGATVTGVRAKPSLDDARLVMRSLRTLYGEDELLALVREHDSTAADDESQPDVTARGDGTALPHPKTDAGDEPTDERSAPATMQQRADVVRQLLTID